MYSKFVFCLTYLAWNSVFKVCMLSCMELWFVFYIAIWDFPLGLCSILPQEGMARLRPAKKVLDLT